MAERIYLAVLFEEKDNLIEQAGYLPTVSSSVIFDAKRKRWYTKQVRNKERTES